MKNILKELESKLDRKLDFLNYATTSISSTKNNIDNDVDININKDEDKDKEVDIFEKYSLNKPELSDITKAYLSSYTSTVARPELSDFSKAYISSSYTGTTSSNNNPRPELSNLTMEYLMKNTTDFSKDDK